MPQPTLLNYMFHRLNTNGLLVSEIVQFIEESFWCANIYNSPLKMIPDFKQQISELEKQKQDLENRLSEPTEKMKGN
jgi:hypothetical protein